MNKMPYKVRIGIAITLFFWSIGAFIATVVCSQLGLGTWVLIVGPTFTITAFILFVIIMPKVNDNGAPTVVKKNRDVKKTKHQKSKNLFVSGKEWEELDEEDEECFYIEEQNKDIE